MLEEVPVGEQAPEQAPGRVGMLELVRVEDPKGDQGDAGDEEGDGGEQDEGDGEIAPRLGRGARLTLVELQPLMIVLWHLGRVWRRPEIDRRPAAGYLKRGPSSTGFRPPPEATKRRSLRR